jgi:hypothetical protein
MKSELLIATPKENEAICRKDPVRPDIPRSWRIESLNNTREVFIWGKRIGFNLWFDACICVAHLEGIPTTEKELMTMNPGDHSIFYTVWSAKKGAGRQIIVSTLEHLKTKFLPTQRYITMSPKTEMAMKFHLKNGAILLQENEETNNFEY